MAGVIDLTSCEVDAAIIDLTDERPPKRKKAKSEDACMDLPADKDDGGGHAASRALAMKLNEKESLRLAQEMQDEEYERQESERVGSEFARKIDEKEQKSRISLEEERQESERAGFEFARKIDEEEQKSRISLERHSAPATKEEVWKKLTGCQQAAMRHVDSVARGLHDTALPVLRERVLALGFKHADLDALLAYVRDDAPIVVHLGVETLALLCKDPWYRSQFETGTSKGTNDRARRQTWEDAMFAGAYAAASDGEHPKYGCFNVTGDIRGVRGAKQYGEFFITLAPAVRHRTSFSNDGTGKRQGLGKVATNALYAHVLCEYSEVELTRVLRVARSARLHGAPSTDFAYFKECQIHGTISIASDVLVLSVPGKRAAASAELLQHVEAFRFISDCNILWQGDLLGI